MPRFLDSKVTTAILTALALWFGLLAVGSYVRHAATKREFSDLEQRIAAGEAENTHLAAEVQRIRQPSWLALLARQRLDYQRPDETVVFVYKSEKAGTISQPVADSGTAPDRRANWQKWLDWVGGN